MMLEVGTCAGIENYARHLSQRQAGERPAVPLRLFPRGLPRRRRRIARLVAADRRDVQRRPRAQADARRARLPAAECARQSPVDVRRVSHVDAAGDLRVGDAGRARAAAVGGRRRRADHSSDGPGRSRDRRAAGARSGGRPAQRDSHSRASRRARARHDAHQADGGRPHRLSPADGRARPLHALRHRRHRAHGDHSRAPVRRVRRAGGDQPAARGAGSARGVAGRDSRCRSGGIPAQRALAHPDGRPCRAAHRRARRSSTPTA